MAREFGRAQRLADFLKRELALHIQKDLRDPRIGMVGVNAVEVSRDFSYAKVFVTFLGKEGKEQAAEPLKALNSAAGFLRTQVASGTKMRITPKLRFYFDSSIERGSHISSLITEAVAADQKFHQGGGAGDSDNSDDLNDTVKE